MENIKKMYTLSVPCITQFVKDEDVLDISDLPEKLWISSKCICRVSNKSLLIVNGLYQAFYSEGDFKEHFKDGLYFNKSNLNAGQVDQLIKKKIIDLNGDGQTPPVVHYYDDCISAYYATLEITQRCNAKCIYCYNGFERNTCEPTLDTIKNRILKLKSLGVQYIEITGGEPLLRNDIEEITRFIKENELKYCLATNGSLLLLHQEVALGAESVSISMDGDREFHNMIRGCNIYDKVIQSLNFLHENSVRTLISMTVTDENEKYIDHVINIANRYETELILAAVVPTGKARGMKYASHKLTNVSRQLTLKGYKDSLERPKVEINKDAYFYGCDMGRKGFTVSVKGDVLPCLFMRNFSIGKLDGMSIDKYRNIVSDMCVARRKSVKKCETCDNDRCGGLCIFSKSHKMRRKKNYSSEDQYCITILEESND